MRKFRFILRQAQDEVERFQWVSLMVSCRTMGRIVFQQPAEQPASQMDAGSSGTLESINPRLCYACFAGAV